MNKETEARTSRLRRRGANAVEFALIMPVLIMFIGGIADYGWFFWREALATNSLREAVRAGSLRKQDATEMGFGACAACLSVANTMGQAALSANGFSVTLDATLERIPATGLPCTYAIVLAPSIPHPRILPLVPGPDAVNVRVLSMAQNVPCT